MAVLTGLSDKLIPLQANVEINGLLASADKGIALSSRTDIATNLLGSFGIGFTTPEWILLEDSSVLLYENGTTKVYLE